MRILWPRDGGELFTAIHKIYECEQRHIKFNLVDHVCNFVDDKSKQCEFDFLTDIKQFLTQASDWDYFPVFISPSTSVGSYKAVNLGNLFICLTLM